ncbi:MAG: hypothetical protein K0R83_763 [Caulobacter sp.]|nr:hypothetical protein [Caulobacter sp.]
MSEPPAIVADAAARTRKDRIHGAMLIEVLVLLVFLAMTFAFLGKPRVDPKDKQIADLKLEVSRLKRQVSELSVWALELEKANQSLAAELRRYKADPNSIPSASDRFATLEKLELRKLVADRANKSAIIDEQQKTIASQNARLRAAGKGGADLPPCSVTPGYLISVDLLAGGRFKARAAWTSDAAGAVSAVPGVQALVDAGPMSRDAFLERARPIYDWGRAQSVPCGFRAEVRETHGDLTLYKSQVSTVERFFYVRRR